MLSMLGKIFSASILKYFFLLSQKIVFDISCKLSPRENRRTIINLSSAESAQRVYVEG